MSKKTEGLKKEALPRNKAETVIIGGGIMGLGLAYNLAVRGHRDVIVLEKNYLCFGASGRNGGGIRAQWSSADNISIMNRSVELCKRFARHMGMNIWFRQGGYLFLAPDDTILEGLEKSVKLQREHGLKTRLIKPEEALRIVPELNISKIRGGAYNPDDGIVFPWPFIWGYTQAARDHGVLVLPHTEVTGMETSAGKITKIRTDRGDIEPGTVVNATGAWSPEIARMANVELPNRPHRHEILVCEALKPWLKPMVSLLGSGLYFSQSMRGEIVGGMGDPDEPESLSLSSSGRFLKRFASTAVNLCPALSTIRVIRQWAGPYDVSPDGHPVVGEVPEIKNFIQLVGFTGHGFMMAPAVTEMCAEWMTGGKKDPFFDKYTVDRFRNGGTGYTAESMIIG